MNETSAGTNKVVQDMNEKMIAQMKLIEENKAKGEKAIREFFSTINFKEARAILISTIDERGDVKFAKVGPDIDVMVMHEVGTTAIKLGFLGFSKKHLGGQEL